MANELQAISIIVVFVTVAFGLLMPDIWEKLSIGISNYKKNTEVRKNTLSRYYSLLWFKSVPMLALCALPAYLLIPRLRLIFDQSQFDLWNFDLLTSLFVVIDIYLLIGTVVILVTVVRLFQKIHELKKYFET